MIELLVNSKPCHLPQPVSLAELMRANQLDQASGIAVAVNDWVIPRTDWQNTLLQSQDKITVITATQGG